MIRVSSKPGLRSVMLVLVLSLGLGDTRAATASPPSPGLERPPEAVLTMLDRCLGNASASRREPDAPRHYVLAHVEAWFNTFHDPVHVRLYEQLRDAGDAADERRLDAMISDRIDRLRHLTDFRTEQTLITVLDAALRRHGAGRHCQAAGARLMLAMAAQRDRAWAWADAMERLLAMDRERRRTAARSQALAEALRDIERAYRDLEPHMD